MKDFDTWNIQKKNINNTDSEISGYHPREVWWCRMGLNIGFEQDGKDVEFMRPVLILKGLGPHTLLIAPLTSSSHEHKYRVTIGELEGKQSKVIISQIRVIDIKRLVDKIGYIDKEIFKHIQKTARELLF
jgi:mRNA interferase MazF